VARLLKEGCAAAGRWAAKAGSGRDLGRRDRGIVAQPEGAMGLARVPHDADVQQLEALSQEILARVNALDKLVREHQPIWDSDHRLHDTLLRRLAIIERSTRPAEMVVASTEVNVATMATKLRDFLGIAGADDPESTTMSIGTREIEIPAWDTVILPWVRAYGEWEPAVGKLLEEVVTPGAVVIEVGAHVGIFTLELSKRVGARGRVVAVEADPINARFLRRNVMKSHCNNVMVLEVAATDRTGTVKLSRSIEDNTGDSRAFDIPTAAEVLEVPGLALDEVIVGPVHFVKMDLQGTDHVAMRGISRTIDEYRPVILTEFWPAGIREYGDDPVQVLAWFRELGYSWSAIEVPELTDAKSDEEICAAAEALPTGFCDLMLRARRL